MESHYQSRRECKHEWWRVCTFPPVYREKVVPPAHNTVCGFLTPQNIKHELYLLPLQVSNLHLHNSVLVLAFIRKLEDRK